MNISSPGLDDRRLVSLMRVAVARCNLCLADKIVFTEAATGVYVVTPIIAALAGAKKVYALTKPTSYGTIEEVAELTSHVAHLAGVEKQIQITTEKSPLFLSESNVVTNSGHVRPIDAEMIRSMRPDAVVPLMYESWELRPNEVDLEACKARGIKVAGTNERHPHVDVFSYLGVMAIKLLFDAGMAVYQNRILVVCDNPFAPYLFKALVGAGAIVELVERLSQATAKEPDLILVATKPRAELVIGLKEGKEIVKRWPETIVVQYWGDIDRAALSDLGVRYWPIKPPCLGHMAVLPSAVGPEPVIRLQAGGLKVAEVLLARESKTPPALEYVDAV